MHVEQTPMRLESLAIGWWLQTANSEDTADRAGGPPNGPIFERKAWTLKSPRSVIHTGEYESQQQRQWWACKTSHEGKSQMLWLPSAEV